MKKCFIIKLLSLYDSLNEAVNITLEIALKGRCVSQEKLDKLNAEI